MNGDNNPNFSKEESIRKDSGPRIIQQGSYEESGKKPPGNHLIRCDVCSCEMSSAAVLNSHINGSRHKKKIKALQIVASLKAMSQKGIDVGYEINTNYYKCNLCCLTVNSLQQLEIHLSGSKHKSNIAKEKSLEFANITSMKHDSVCTAPSDNDDTPPLKKKKKDEQALTCEICNIGVNSETQYEQHVYSKKHLNRSKGENIAKKPTALENETNTLQKLTPGNRFFGSKEPEACNSQDEKFVKQFRSNIASNIIQVHLPGNNFSQTFNQSKSEFGNLSPVNNYNANPRHFINNRQFRVQFCGIGLYDVGKFFSKPRCNIFNSDKSIVHVLPRS